MTPAWLLASAALLLGLLFTKRGYWAWVAAWPAGPAQVRPTMIVIGELGLEL